VWLTPFSTVNIASQLGIAPAKFQLTVDDIQRDGPGIVVDDASRGAFRVTRGEPEQVGDGSPFPAPRPATMFGS
jgi:hypothetical protein